MDNFREAPEVDVWIEKVIQKYEEFYQIKKIGFRSIFRFNEKKKGDKLIFASVFHIPEKYLLYIDADLLMEVWYDGWFKLSEREKEALIYHELCHVEIVDTDDKVKIKLIPHDFEGFIKEYKYFGNWRGDLPEIKSNDNGEDIDDE